MNENLNLVEILKDCPSKTPLYSTVVGGVLFRKIISNGQLIEVIYPCGNVLYFKKNGELAEYEGGECLLFPSKDQRDWTKFEAHVERFDPKEFKPFDKVLARDKNTEKWIPSLYAFLENDEVVCIPYTYE